MKTFKQLCEQTRNNSTKRMSLNLKPQKINQSFRSIIEKAQYRKITPHQTISHKTIFNNSTDTRLFTNLVRQLNQKKEHSQQLTESNQTFSNNIPSPTKHSSKRRIKINRKADIIDQTPIRPVNCKNKQQETTATLLTTSEKKEIQSDINRVTQKIKQRLISKQISKYSQSPSISKEGQEINTKKGDLSNNSFGKIDFVCSSIKSKKNTKKSNQKLQKLSEGECGVCTTDRFQNSLIHTLEQALQKIHIFPIVQTQNSNITTISNQLEQPSMISRRSSNSKFSTKSIKNRLLSTNKTNNL